MPRKRPTGDLPAEPYPPVDIPHLDPPAGLDEALRESFPRERMLSRVDRELLDQYFKTSGLLTRPAPPELAVEAALVQAAFATGVSRALSAHCRGDPTGGPLLRRLRIGPRRLGAGPAVVAATRCGAHPHGP